MVKPQGGSPLSLFRILAAVICIYISTGRPRGGCFLGGWGLRCADPGSLLYRRYAEVKVEG